MAEDYDSKKAYWNRQVAGLRIRIAKTSSDKKRSEYEALLKDYLAHPPKGK